MTNVQIKNLPQLHLSNLLKRRKQTLRKFVTDLGVTSYDGLVKLCQTIGVIPPSESEYNTVIPVAVNSPQDGIVVIADPEDMVVPEVEEPVKSRRGRRKKTEDDTNE